MVDELRPVAYIAAGTLQRKLELIGRMSRDEFDGLLGAMVCAGLVEIEEASFEKNGEVLRFRKVMLTDSGLNVRPATPLELLIADGIVEEFDVGVPPPRRTKPSKSAPRKTADAATISPQPTTPASEALAVRLREWRTAEAKRLGVPAYVVLHDRTLQAVAIARPANPAQLLTIDGIGPAKVERFGEEILKMCALSSG
jgi:superfamily II DNA helicase RecQ